MYCGDGSIGLQWILRLMRRTVDECDDGIACKLAVWLCGHGKNITIKIWRSTLNFLTISTRSKIPLFPNKIPIFSFVSLKLGQSWEIKIRRRWEGRQQFCMHTRRKTFLCICKRRKLCWWVLWDFSLGTRV